MPTHKARGGWQYGPTGKIYRGKGARAKAAKQGRAIAISKARAAGHRIPPKPGGAGKKRRRARAPARKRR